MRPGAGGWQQSIANEHWASFGMVRRCVPRTSSSPMLTAHEALQRRLHHRCWPAAALGIKGNSHRDWDTRNVLRRTGFVARSMPSAYATELTHPLTVQQPQKSMIRLNC